MEKVYSRFYYPIEYYNPHVHLEYNNNNLGLNEAEIKALQHEEYKNRYEQIKELKNKEYIKKYGKSAYLFEEEKKMKNKEEELSKKREQEEQLLKKQTYNKSVYEKNMKLYSKEKPLKEKAKTIKTNKGKNENKKDAQTNEHYTQKICNIENESIIPRNSNQNDINDYSDVLENKEILENLYKKENLNNNINTNINSNDACLDNNVVDLRYNLENQLLEEINKKNKNLNNNEIKEEVNDKISTIKKFRTYGFLPDQTPQDIKIEKKKKKDNKKKFSSEFERRRFIKALNNLITERLGQHNIYIQNICSCGNLQKQLTSIFEKGNQTIYALTDVNCANNCAFYKNKKEYLKSINDVLNSIKDIAYENFNNKHKEDK